VHRAGLGQGRFPESHGPRNWTCGVNFSVLLPGVEPGVGAWWVPALVLGASQGVANHAVPRQAAVGAAQPGPPQFYHTDTDAQSADGDNVRVPQAGRVPDPQ
jgi:hypothetical protein